MTSLTLLPPYPIYFFDQPAPPRSKKGKVATAGKPKEDKKEKRAENGKQLKLLKKVKSDCLAETSANEETCEDESTDDESEDPLASQKRAAPRLLNELGRLLHRHRGASLQVGHLLNYSAEAALKPPPPAKDAAPRRAARRKKSPKKSSKANQDATDDDAAATDEASAVSPTPTDEMISGGGQEPDWLALPLQALGEDTPPPRGLCQWVVERLQASNSLHIKRRVLDQVPSSPILRHYVDAKAGTKSRSVLSAASEAAEPTPQRTPSPPPPLKKLHCRSTDGTSFIYYPSGNMAVCHSPSGLPAGGFCTNVFADSHASAVLATVTAFGHGSASHPVSSAVTALWDRHGGFMCDWEGNLKKEWCWKTDREQDKIVVKLAKGISLRLLSGTSAVLCFKCEDNKVQLALSALPYSAKEAEAEQTFPEASAGTLSARWTKGCHGAGGLTKMRKKVRDILDAWLDLYRSATGTCHRRRRRSLACSTRRSMRRGTSPAVTRRRVAPTCRYEAQREKAQDPQGQAQEAGARVGAARQEVTRAGPRQAGQDQRESGGGSQTGVARQENATGSPPQDQGTRQEHQGAQYDPDRTPSHPGKHQTGVGDPSRPSRPAFGGPAPLARALSAGAVGAAHRVPPAAAGGPAQAAYGPRPQEVLLQHGADARAAGRGVRRLCHGPAAAQPADPGGGGHAARQTRVGAGAGRRPAALPQVQPEPNHALRSVPDGLLSPAEVRGVHGGPGLPGGQHSPAASPQRRRRHDPDVHPRATDVFGLRLQPSLHLLRLGPPEANFENQGGLQDGCQPPSRLQIQRERQGQRERPGSLQRK
ncbi:uncharacterized protein [Syngnathus scovelli]|uniref:uncharacterized protein isoform X3 n=1 Tax=Syngnathus scovelli TaxID=161590 RepID=UPI002110B18A|nr:uncharacterized protein LOC125970265 isoform X3 [Syngnathus scovelli]